MMSRIRMRIAAPMLMYMFPLSVNGKVPARPALANIPRAFSMVSDGSRADRPQPVGLAAEDVRSLLAMRAEPVRERAGRRVHEGHPLSSPVRRREALEGLEVALVVLGAVAFELVAALTY
jgi:hypothetical protein